jgi:transposase
MQRPIRVQTANFSGRQTVQETITSYVGLDIHKDSVAIAIAEGRAAPRFIGTIGPLPSELCKTLRRQRCRPESTLLVYEAGPCGYGWVRYLRKQHGRCEVIAPSRRLSSEELNLLAQE